MDTKKIIISSLFLLAAVIVSAQSNEIIDDILEQDKLSCGNGAYLALSAGGLIPVDSSTEEAAAFMIERGWLSSAKSETDEMSLGEYSLAIMKAFKIKGGLMYTLFPSPRYASRELGYLGYISRDSGAYRTLGGGEAVSILGQILREMR